MIQQPIWQFAAALAVLGVVLFLLPADARLPLGLILVLGALFVSTKGQTAEQREAAARAPIDAARKALFGG